MKIVYLNNKRIIFSNDITTQTNFRKIAHNDIDIEELLHKLKNTKIKGLQLIHNDVDFMWNDFLKNFDSVIAAGGIVRNEQNEFLLIYRNRHWDLPKGRQEKGEEIKDTALREVEEECDISGLKIKEFIKPTYHIYFEKNRKKLKTTYWYEMLYSGNSCPKPQKEEGIEQAKFVTVNELKSLHNTMYKNIEDLILNYI